jgi:hypothetical protein
MKRIASMLGIASLVACGGSGAGSSTTPACDAACKDGVALVSLRLAIKLVYNLTLQSQPVGPQSGMLPNAMQPMACLGGMASVSGTASSNADQGTTTVNLTYVFTSCHYLVIDPDPTQTFDMTLDGTVTEVGTIAVQPSSTTALEFTSAAFSFDGTVYGPPIDYVQKGCALQLAQDGNNLSGTFCGRDAGTTL